MFGNYIKGSIHGFKFEDVDADGVYEPGDGEVPFEDIPFELWDVDGNLVSKANTDETGGFDFTGLIPRQA